MTTEQAKLEIQRLQKLIDIHKESEVPKPLENPDFSQLIKLANSHIKTISNDGFSDENSDYWFYETQIEILNKKVEKLELEIKQIKQSFEPLSESKRKELLKESFNRALSEFAANGQG